MVWSVGSARGALSVLLHLSGLVSSSTLWGQKHRAAVSDPQHSAWHLEDLCLFAVTAKVPLAHCMPQQEPGPCPCTPAIHARPRDLLSPENVFDTLVKSVTVSSLAIRAR